VTARRLYMVGLLFLFLIGLGAIVATGLHHVEAPPFGNPMGDDLVSIAGSGSAGQLFTAPLPGLCCVQVTLHETMTGSAGLLTFHLQAWPGSAGDLWTAQVDPAAVQPGQPHKFEFPPIRDSRGKRYYLYLESPGAAPASGLAVGYSSMAVLDGAGAYLDGQPVTGNLQFSTEYRLTSWEKADLLLARIATGRPGLLGIKELYAIPAAAYALILGAFVLRVAGLIIEEQEQG